MYRICNLKKRFRRRWWRWWCDHHTSRCTTESVVHRPGVMLMVWGPRQTSSIPSVPFLTHCHSTLARQSLQKFFPIFGITDALLEGEGYWSYNCTFTASLIYGGRVHSTTWGFFEQCNAVCSPCALVLALTFYGFWKY